MISNYLQANNKKQVAEFLEGVPEGCVIEVTVHSEQKKLFVKRAQIRIDDELVYDFDFARKTYYNFKQPVGNGEFYLTDTEAFALSLYVGTLSCGTPVVPHWWPYAERNISRHGNPLKELREAQEHRRKIVITVD